MLGSPGDGVGAGNHVSTFRDPSSVGLNAIGAVFFVPETVKGWCRTEISGWANQIDQIVRRNPRAVFGTKAFGPMTSHLFPLMKPYRHKRSHLASGILMYFIGHDFQDSPCTFVLDNETESWKALAAHLCDELSW